MTRNIADVKDGHNFKDTFLYEYITKTKFYLCNATCTPRYITQTPNIYIRNTRLG